MITKKDIKKEWKNILFNGIFAFLTLITTILLYNDITLAIIGIIGLIKWKSKITFILFIFGAIFGTFSEILAINHGLWSYAKINFINVPLWLFLVWGNYAAFLYQTSLEIKKLGIKK